MALCCGGRAHLLCNSTPLPSPYLVSPIEPSKPNFNFSFNFRKKRPLVSFPWTAETGGRALQITSAASRHHSKIANLFAKRKERVKLPIYGDGRGIDQFLCHPSGVEAILNKKSFTTFESLDSNTYRCTLPKVKFLNFEVAPILDLRVTPTDEDCTIELLSCKFEGSEVLERQNDRFLACMRNHMTWDANDSQQFLDLDIELNVSLEIYTQPFSSLPISAVEKPGNLMMQSLLDRLFQVLLRRLLLDYDCWVRERWSFTP